MSDKKVKKLIYLQAKHLTNAIPYDSMVYIHWDNGTPLVLADKQKGFGVVTSVRLKTCLLYTSPSPRD